MGWTEYVLLAWVSLVPLVIATAVTAWSLEQVRYLPKRARRPPSVDPTPPGPDAGSAEPRPPRTA